jgi:uracil-DNA glycosylase
VRGQMDSVGAFSVLRWWQEAGVDTLVAETPFDWLAPEKRSAATSSRVSDAAASPLPAPAAREREIPDTLPALQEWLLDGDVPLAVPGAPRVGPSGDPAAGLMVLIDMPSPEDVEAGRLLSDEPGNLFDRMMAAIGRSRETLYLASLTPIRTPTGRFDEAAAAELAAIARRHIALAAPRALLLFGDSCARVLLGATVAQARGKSHELETPAGEIRTFVTMRPEKLVKQPGLKKYAWEDLQRLREELQP